MNVVAAAVGQVVPKLLQLLGDEHKLQRDLRKHVKWLEHELESIHTFLRKVSDVRRWKINELKMKDRKVNFKPIFGY